MLISCRQGLHDGEYLTYLKGDLDRPCGDTQHMTAIMMIGIPTLLIWVVGMPLFIYVRLTLHKQIIHQDKIRFRYGMLMQGYEDEYFSWEAIIATRKMLVIGISVFMSQFTVDVQTYAAIAVVIFFMTLHISANPFFRKDLDMMEKWSLASSFVTLYVGLLFYITQQEEVHGSIVVICGSMLIVGLNVGYLVYAIYQIFKFTVDAHKGKGVCGLLFFCISAIPGIGMAAKCFQSLGLLVGNKNKKTKTKKGGRKKCCRCLRKKKKKIKKNKESKDLTKVSPSPPKEEKRKLFVSDSKKTKTIIQL